MPKPSQEAAAFSELLRAAWENGVGYGGDPGERDDANDDAAFVTWVGEHEREIGQLIMAMADRGAERERTRVSELVRSLAIPLAWRNFRARHHLGGERVSPPADFTSALAEAIMRGW